MPFCKKCGSLIKLGECSRGCKDPLVEEEPEKSKIDSYTISRLGEIIKQIHDGIVFAEFDELESLLGIASDKKTENMIKECISDMKGGIYVRFTCTGREELRKGCYIYAGLKDIDYICYIPLDEVPCNDSNLCYGGLVRDTEDSRLKCRFRGSHRKIQKAKQLLASL